MDSYRAQGSPNTRLLEVEPSAFFRAVERPRKGAQNTLEMEKVKTTLIFYIALPDSGRGGITYKIITFVKIF
jgi:hypothetical protein